VYFWSNWRLSDRLRPEYGNEGFVEGVTEPNNKDGFEKLEMELRMTSGVAAAEDTQGLRNHLCLESMCELYK
jgi:hypothetical protein